MKSEIKLKDGTPNENGYYLTVRKSRFDGSTRVTLNYWSLNAQDWLEAIADGSDIIAWFRVDDINIEQE